MHGRTCREDCMVCIRHSSAASAVLVVFMELGCLAAVMRDQKRKQHQGLHHTEFLPAQLKITALRKIQRLHRLIYACLMGAL